MHRLAGSDSPFRFGRRSPFVLTLDMPGAGLSNDARLFLMTYAGGFVAVSLFIA